MGRDVENEGTWNREEGRLADATRLAGALGDLLEEVAADAPTSCRGEISYIKALARTPSDSLSSLRPGRSS